MRFRWRARREALQRTEEDAFDVVVTDIKMPGDIDGPGVLSGVKKIDPSVPVVIRPPSRRRRPRSRP
jgi:DNA-binding NtrC family response regulator